jgi:hypothetical protein
MPRSNRKATTGPAADALDAAVGAYNEVEALLAVRHDELLVAMVKAVRAGMPKAEAARRAGYSREHGSRLIDAYEREHATDAAQVPSAK